MEHALYNKNLQKLKVYLSKNKHTAILVPMRCSFDNCENQLSDIALISGFTGSNGKAIISSDKAILCVDGRYISQAMRQVDHKIWNIESYPKCTLESMIKETLQPGDTLVLSSMAHSYKTYMNIKIFAKEIGVNIQTTDTHPVIDFRSNECKKNTIVITDKTDIESRLSTVKNSIPTKELIIISDSNTISWIFGIRKEHLGHDKGPLANAIALISKNSKPIIFSDLKVEKNDFFDSYMIKDFESVISSNFKEKIITIDPSHIPAYFVKCLENAGFDVAHKKQTQYNKTKTTREIEDQQTAAHNTSISFIKMLSYTEYFASNNKCITENDAIAYFESKDARGYSFNPICACGKNTAIVHYNPELCESNAEIKNETLMLFDAGFHFDNASTDMTRTIYIGNNPDKKYKFIYTKILKSIIMFSTMKFPTNTEGGALDTIARYHMWKNDMDYNFGTGHGVGNYRNVHEFPRVSKNSRDQISQNMIITVEPGYYTDEFGIRLENMLLTVLNDNNMVSFKTITHVPFDLQLIDKTILTQAEIDWINNYHLEASQKFLPIFKNDPIAFAWLIKNTKQLA